MRLLVGLLLCINQ